MTEYTETDTAAVDGAIAACSGLALNVGAAALQAQVGGTTGSTTYTVNVSSNETKIFMAWESPANDPNVIAWPAGDWVARLDLTQGGPANLTLDQMWVCRVNASGVSQATVGSFTGIGVGLQAGTEGVRTVTVTGISQTALTTDRWYLLLAYHNGLGVGNFKFKSDRVIQTPFGAVPVGGGGLQWQVAGFAGGSSNDRGAVLTG
jgi:hypothetical protein